MIYVQLTLFGVFTTIALGLFILAVFQRPKEMIVLVALGWLFLWLSDMAYHPYVTSFQ